MSSTAFEQRPLTGWTTKKIEALAVAKGGAQLFAGTADGSLMVYDCRPDGAADGHARDRPRSFECNVLEVLRKFSDEGTDERVLLLNFEEQCAGANLQCAGNVVFVHPFVDQSDELALDHERQAIARCARWRAWAAATRHSSPCCRRTSAPPRQRPPPSSPPRPIGLAAPAAGGRGNRASRRSSRPISRARTPARGASMQPT